MVISRKVDYGLRAMLYLAGLDEGSICILKDISKNQNILQKFLAKILNQLVKTGLVKSHRGASGGFCLSKPATEITFMEIIEAIEGPFVFNVCLNKKENCPKIVKCKNIKDCKISIIFKEAQEKIESVFGGKTLSEVLGNINN